MTAWENKRPHANFTVGRRRPVTWKEEKPRSHFPRGNDSHHVLMTHTLRPHCHFLISISSMCSTSLASIIRLHTWGRGSPGEKNGANSSGLQHQWKLNQGENQALSRVPILASVLRAGFTAAGWVRLQMQQKFKSYFCHHWLYSDPQRSPVRQAKVSLLRQCEKEKACKM